jgi:hypothetical protein
MNQGNNKPCIACGEPIQLQAKKCPHCHTWQTRWSLLSEKPYVHYLPLAIFLIIFGVIFLGMYNDLFKQASFLDHKDGIVVIDSKIHFAEKGDCSYITCIGHLRNNSDVAWEDIRFEVQYFNYTGELIDTISDRDFSLVLSPHAEASFRVRGKAARNSDQYVNHKVQIRWADDVR